MRRSSSRLPAGLILGVIAAGAASGFGCKGPVVTANPGHMIVEASDGGVQTTFDLGQACVGYSSTRTLFLDSAASSYNVTGIAVTVGGTFYSVTQPTSTDVVSGIPVPFTVTFTPPPGSNSQAVAGKIVITSTSSDNSPLTIDLTGTVASAPAYSIFQPTCAGSSQDCTVLEFNNAPVFGSQSQVVTVTNAGCPPLDLSAMLDAGNLAYSFSADAGLSPLPYNESVPVVVTFSPTNMTAQQDWLVFSSSYPDAGLPYGISLIGSGIAPLIVWNPTSGNFQGALPGVLSCETFMLTNTGTSTATIDPPLIDNPEVNGKPAASVFTIDAGWGLNTPLAAQQSLPCTVCVDFHDAGVSYSADLDAPYSTSTSSGTAKAFLTSSSSGSLCPSTVALDLPDDKMFCGVETGSFELMSCTDGGACVTITSIGWLDAGGNFDNLASVSVTSPGGPPWTVCPGGTPLTVDVTFRDNGKIKYLTDTVAIASDATSMPITTVLVVPVTHAVSFEDPAVLCDAGTGDVPIFTPVACEVTGLDDGGVNFEYFWYYLAAMDGTGYLDAGADDLEADFTPTEPDSYFVCVEQVEVDAGFGNCGFISGGLDAGPEGSRSYCSAEPIMANE
jgi:hypothetical protein